MVFMLRLIPGLLLFYVCAVQAAEVQKPISDIKNSFSSIDQNVTNEFYSNENDNDALIPNKKYGEKTDKDVENIVEPFKFTKNDGGNYSSIKLKKSESYSTTQKSSSENSRTGSGRSVDIDIEKYISPDFYNAVYTVPVSSNTKSYVNDEEFHGHHSTEETSSFENIGHLTTPKTPYFDEKYKQTVESVNQKLEDSLEADFDNVTHSSNYSLDNLIEDADKNPNGTKYEFKNFENIELNKTQKGQNAHRDATQESRKILTFENKYNNTNVYDEKIPNEDNNELRKENIKYLLGSEDANEVRKQDTEIKISSTSRINLHPTTRKYSITKPPTGKLDAGIISNKIESETIKSLPVTTYHSNAETPEVPTATPSTKRGSIKFADYQKLSGTGVSPNTNNKTFEQVVQENQIVPVQVTPPTAIFETTISQKITSNEQIDTAPRENVTEKTTESGIGNVTSKNITTEPDEQQSTTVLIIVQPDEPLHYTTTERARTTTLTSIPRGFRLATTTQTIVPTTEIPETTTKYENINEEGTTLTNRETTTIKQDVTTEIPDMMTTEEFGPQEITTEIPTSTKKTNEVIEITTLPSETTTMVLEQTTLSEPRSSKDIKFSKLFPSTTTESMEETTIKRTDAFEITLSPTDKPVSTTPEDLTTETIQIETTTSTEVQMTTITLSKDITSELSTKIIINSTPTKTLLENRTTEEKSTSEFKTTPTTSISFVHIKNIDKNHTTLLPDVLKPNEIYTTPMPLETSTKTTATEATTTDEHSMDLDGGGGNSGAIVAIIISCVGGTCLIILAGLLIVMRNRQKRFNYGQRCRPVSLDDYSVDNVSVFNSVRRKAAARGSKRSYGNPAFEDPVCVSHPLNFPAISKFANNLEDVNAEFSEIPQIIARTSELPEGCETKNRYANVIPLPESRVFLNQLNGYPNSDYINANYVTGPKNIRKYYIACQAPMSNTVDDFWRMMWEQQCKVILMLTHLFENGAEKCFDYLPPSEVLDCHRLFGDFQVTLKKREVKEKYIISSIQLKNMVSNSWREVTHFWYMGWPEKGVPAEANSIIAFLIEARSYMKSATIDKKTTLNGDMNGTFSDVNPVVVHCSPGTGRTGVAITCDIAIREFEQTRQVDIPKIVYRMRRDRANAVQTKEQYAFIYKVIDLYATKLAGGSLESI